MGYSDNDSMVRCSIFKRSGKWYEDIALDMTGHWNDGLPYDAVLGALRIQAPHYLWDWYVVVLDPCHEFEYPVIILPESS